MSIFKNITDSVSNISTRAVALLGLGAVGFGLFGNALPSEAQQKKPNTNQIQAKDDTSAFVRPPGMSDKAWNTWKEKQSQSPPPPAPGKKSGKKSNSHTSNNIRKADTDDKRITAPNYVKNLLDTANGRNDLHRSFLYGGFTTSPEKNSFPTNSGGLHAFQAGGEIDLGRMLHILPNDLLRMGGNYQLAFNDPNSFGGTGTSVNPNGVYSSSYKFSPSRASLILKMGHDFGHDVSKGTTFYPYGWGMAQNYFGAKNNLLNYSNYAAGVGVDFGLQSPSGGGILFSAMVGRMAFGKGFQMVPTPDKAINFIEFGAKVTFGSRLLQQGNKKGEPIPKRVTDPRRAMIDVQHNDPNEVPSLMINTGRKDANGEDIVEHYRLGIREVVTPDGNVVESLACIPNAEYEAMRIEQMKVLGSEMTDSSLAFTVTHQPQSFENSDAVPIGRGPMVMMPTTG